MTSSHSVTPGGKGSCIGGPVKWAAAGNDEFSPQTGLLTWALILRYL